MRKVYSTSVASLQGLNLSFAVCLRPRPGVSRERCALRTTTAIKLTFYATLNLYDTLKTRFRFTFRRYTNKFLFPFFFGSALQLSLRKTSTFLRHVDDLSAWAVYWPCHALKRANWLSDSRKVCLPALLRVGKRRKQINPAASLSIRVAGCWRDRLTSRRRHENENSERILIQTDAVLLWRYFWPASGFNRRFSMKLSS